MIRRHVPIALPNFSIMEGVRADFPLSARIASALLRDGQGASARKEVPSDSVGCNKRACAGHSYRQSEITTDLADVLVGQPWDKMSTSDSRGRQMIGAGGPSDRGVGTACWAVEVRRGVKSGTPKGLLRRTSNPLDRGGGGGSGMWIACGVDEAMKRYVAGTR